jgi:hypothetical protein
LLIHVLWWCLTTKNVWFLKTKSQLWHRVCMITQTKSIDSTSMTQSFNYRNWMPKHNNIMAQETQLSQLWQLKFLTVKQLVKGIPFIPMCMELVKNFANNVHGRQQHHEWAIKKSECWTSQLLEFIHIKFVAWSNQHYGWCSLLYDFQKWL